MSKLDLIAESTAFEEIDGKYREINTSVTPPLTVSQWRERDLPPTEWLLGELLSKTSRALLAAPTGLGKTNFSMRLGVAVATGTAFLHWAASDKRQRVLFIDGELPRDWAQQLMTDMEERLSSEGITLGDDYMYLNTEDVEGMPPLNTPDGKQWLLDFIEEISGVDFIIFDNIMALLKGDMKDEESWKDTLPLVKHLTAKCIGQLWIDHTGIKEDRNYGSATKKWQLDTSMLMKRNGTNGEIDFTLKFDKSRKRTPKNQENYQEVNIALINDEWTSFARTKPCIFDGITQETIFEFQKALSKKGETRNRKDAQSPDWWGQVIAEILNWDMEDHEERLKGLTRELLKSDSFEEDKQIVDRGKPRPIVKVGTLAVTTS